MEKFYRTKNSFLPNDLTIIQVSSIGKWKWKKVGNFSSDAASKNDKPYLYIDYLLFKSVQKEISDRSEANINTRLAGDILTHFISSMG